MSAFIYLTIHTGVRTLNRCYGSKDGVENIVPRSFA